MASDSTSPLLEMVGISKVFPGVRALDDVSFSARAGSVHALCGENGAGKSTLMKILNGIYTPDAGEILMSGHSTKIANPIDAKRHGIAMIPQEMAYPPDITVTEYFFLGELPKKAGFIDWRFMEGETRRLLETEGLGISPRQTLRSLTVAEVQTIEIVKAIYHSADIFVMDEPTSAISHREIQSLFCKIKKLREEGKAIIYISHKLDEVFELADDISVLRDGQLIPTNHDVVVTLSSLI